MNKNRIRGVGVRGKRAKDREAPGAKARRRKSGGRAPKVDALTWGDLASRLKGRRVLRSEESADAVVAATKPMNESEAFVACEGQNERIG